jgi:hypothetical protein
MLQHSLPLQQLAFFGAVAADAVPISAIRLRSNTKYFISSSYSNSSSFGYASFLACRTVALGEGGTRRGNWRTLRPPRNTLVIHLGKLAASHARDEILGFIVVTDEARSLSGTTCRSRTRVCLIRMHRAMLTRIHLQPRATTHLQVRLKSCVEVDRSERRDKHREHQHE